MFPRVPYALQMALPLLAKVQHRQKLRIISSVQHSCPNSKENQQSLHLRKQVGARYIMQTYISFCLAIGPNYLSCVWTKAHVILCSYLNTCYLLLLLCKVILLPWPDTVIHPYRPPTVFPDFPHLTLLSFPFLFPPTAFPSLLSLLKII